MVVDRFPIVFHGTGYTIGMVLDQLVIDEVIAWLELLDINKWIKLVS